MENSKGFIALVSVVVISFILIGLSAVLSTTNFFTRFNVLDSESKKVSLALAEGCVETAMLELAKNANYGSTIPSSGSLVTVSSGKTCKVCSVSASSPYSIVTRASYNRAVSNVTATLSGSGGVFTVQNWGEFATYTGSCSL